MDLNYGCTSLSLCGTYNTSSWCFPYISTNERPTLVQRHPFHGRIYLIHPREMERKSPWQLVKSAPTDRSRGINLHASSSTSQSPNQQHAILILTNQRHATLTNHPVSGIHFSSPPRRKYTDHMDPQRLPGPGVECNDLRRSASLI